MPRAVAAAAPVSVSWVSMSTLAPAAAIHRLHEPMLAHVSKHALPVQRIFKVAHRAVGRPLGMLLVRQNHRCRHRHAQLLGQRVVEELVVRRPPERVVDYHRPVQRRMLQIGAIKRNVVRDAVHNHRVIRRLVQPHRPCLHKLRMNSIEVPRIDVLHQRAGKAVFHPEQNADLLHSAPPLLKPKVRAPKTPPQV